MRRAGLALVFGLACLLASGAVRAGEEVLKVIPPGDEPLVSDMLGGDAELPGSCLLAGASIDRTRVVASYTCAGKPVTLELRHPSDAGAASPAARTAEFAVLAGPDAPRALVDAVVARITTREKSFRWVTAEVQGHKDPGGGHAEPPPPHRVFTSPAAFGGAALLASALSGLAWFLLRRRPRPPAA